MVDRSGLLGGFDFKGLGGDKIKSLKQGGSVTPLPPRSCAGISIMSLKAKYPLTHRGPMGR